ncbi:hypothetical protein [Cohnella panacarvi]|uniref:hypothetical protein n=1 Tax=Cohnella panacarvi TaxID=400776 RepID=UPI00047AA528|nr:hypothetical protein [Cohnella panacarvi]
MRKWLVRLVVLLIVAVIAALAGLFYIRPTEPLDLNARTVPIKERALDMVKRTSLELIVTEADVNNLLKAKLAEDPIVRQDIEVTGAKFTVLGDLLVADLNVLWKDLVPSTLRIVYRLSWDNPNIVATVEEARIKGISLPNSAVAGFVVPLGDELPKPLKVERVEWGVGDLKVKLKKPSLMDLKALL